MLGQSAVPATWNLAPAAAARGDGVPGGTAADLRIDPVAALLEEVGCLADFGSMAAM